HAVDDADEIAGVQDVADLEAAFEVQGDAAEEIAERVLQGETEDRREEGAAGECRADVEVEECVEGPGEEEEVEEQRQDLPQQLRRDNVAAPRHDDVEDEDVDESDEEEDDRGDAEEEEIVVEVELGEVVPVEDE